MATPNEKAIAELFRAVQFLNLAIGDIQLAETLAPQYSPQCEQSVADCKTSITDCIALVTILE